MVPITGVVINLAKLIPVVIITQMVQAIQPIATPTVVDLYLVAIILKTVIHLMSAQVGATHRQRIQAAADPGAVPVAVAVV